MIYVLSLTLSLFISGGDFAQPQITGHVTYDKIREASGLVASRQHKDVFWTHNDSGDKGRIFAIDRSGTCIMRSRIGNTQPFDLEDIAIADKPDGGSWLYLADTGNNDAHKGKPRPHVTIYRVTEPARLDYPRGKKKLIPKALRLTFEDHAHDVETLLVDPRDYSIYLVTKRDKKARLYKATVPESFAGQGKLRFIGELKIGMNVAGDISPNGNEILIKDYGAVWYYNRGQASIEDTLLKQMPSKVPTYFVEPQGEAIAFDAQGLGFYTLSEARLSKSVPLYYYARDRK